MSATTGESYVVHPRSSRWSMRSLARGRAEDARWVRPAVLALLIGTALLYILGLAASGWGNSFYAAAVQAATKSWKAFFFGSFDSSNFITVDKPPASLWVMDLSARLFGVNAWSLLVPQALEGVAAVGLLYLTVRRRFGAAAGLLAGAMLAITPVAVLMFRFDNPDALLTLLLVAAAYALTRSLERASTKWLVLAASLIGFGFLTKMLQVLTVVPGFALVYLIAAPTPLRRRILQLLYGAAALVVSGGWWVAVVELWPASSRPYIGGSQDNSLLNLIFGYNGFGRITGNESGSVIGGGAGRAGAWGPTGLTRLFGAEMGTQISWLLPAALLAIPLLLWVWRRAPRTDARRAAVLIWGTWLVVTGVVFSLAQGIIHPYYTVALAPAIAALVAIGAVWAWHHRDALYARLTAAALLVVTVVWSYRLLERTPAWQPWLRTAILVLGLIAAVGLALPPRVVRLRAAVAAVAIVAGLAAPAAYALETATTPHTGAIPSAGPAGASNGGVPGGGRRAAFGGGAPQGFQRGTPPPGFGGGTRPQGLPPAGFAGGRGGALGGLLNAGTPNQALVKLLQTDASRYRWVAAAVGANSAAGVQVATDDAIMAIGGFNGTDPTPTLAQFKSYVAHGEIHYFIAGGRGGGFGGSSESSAIGTWVAAHFTAQTVGGTTVYDLTKNAS